MTKQERKRLKLEKNSEVRTYWLEALLMLLGLAGLCFFLFSGCTVHNYNMSPNIYYLTQDNAGISICRVDQQGGTICDRNLDIFKGKKVFVIPENQFSND
jgi:steroid 5-alpha reductase family enzyme